MFINIKSFDAVGDGKNDDTAALKKALVSGKTVYFPTGIYLVHEQLTADRVSVYWYGAGSSSVIRLIPNKDTCRVNSFRQCEVFDMRLLLLRDCSEVELHDLTLDANRETFADDVCGIGSSENDYTTCLDIHRTASVVMRGVTCRGGLIEGVYIFAAKKIQIEHCSFLDNGFYRHDASGLQIDGQMSESADVHIIGCEFSRNGFNGLELTGVKGADIRDVLCRENGFDGIAFWAGEVQMHIRMHFAIFILTEILLHDFQMYTFHQQMVIFGIQCLFLKTGNSIKNVALCRVVTQKGSGLYMNKWQTCATVHLFCLTQDCVPVPLICTLSSFQSETIAFTPNKKCTPCSIRGGIVSKLESLAIFAL